MMTFGLAWIAFALAIAVHVADEAAHDFLAVYNPMARAIRQRLLLPIPTFSFSVWLGGLIAGIVLLLLLSPAAFGGSHQLRLIAWPLAILIGIGNALLHFAGSIRFGRPMPGVYSSPLLLAAGVFLLWAA
jgi:hypothetical protein